MTNPKEMRLLRLKMNEEKQNGQATFNSKAYHEQIKRIDAEIKLEQAKKIIKEMLPYMPKENIEGVYEIVTHAEEFIKEIEE